MTSLLKSEAAFKERALECGLTEAECNALISRGVTTLSAVAYAVSTPGVNPTEAALRGLLSQDNPDAVTIGSLAAIRRLVFESQTLAIAEVKLAIEGSDGDRRSELAPAERASRIAAQKAKLAGYDLSGTMEVAHSCYTYVGTMIDSDSPFTLNLTSSSRVLRRLLMSGREKRSFLMPLNLLCVTRLPITECRSKTSSNYPKHLLAGASHAI